MSTLIYNCYSYTLQKGRREFKNYVVCTCPPPNSAMFLDKFIVYILQGHMFSEVSNSFEDVRMCKNAKVHYPKMCV